MQQIISRAWFSLLSSSLGATTANARSTTSTLRAIACGNSMGWRN